MEKETELTFENSSEQILITGIIDKVRREKEKGFDVRTMDFPFLFSLLTDEEREYVDMISHLHPAEFGYRGEYFGIQEVPDDLVPVEGSKNEQILPLEVNKAFEKMNAEMQAQIGKKVVVFSGYRSPAYQMIVFLWNLRDKKCNLAEVFKSVALPGYSEHGHPARQAIDIMIEGQEKLTGTDSAFATTEEYKWLKENAARFGFYESYPENGTSGIMHEPWHWHYEAPQE